jgi:hypothetical protein
VVIELINVWGWFITTAVNNGWAMDDKTGNAIYDITAMRIVAI